MIYWSKKYKLYSCKKCGGTHHKPTAWGLCRLCYKRKRNHYKDIKNKWSIRNDVCIVCGKTDKYHEAHGLCSLCYGRRRHPLRGERRKISKIIKCSTCGKEFRQYKYRIERSERLFCSRECSDIGRSGERSHFWRGGSSGWFHYPKQFKKIRGLIRDRDNHKCKLCDVPEIECKTKLHVHHIDYDKQNINFNNLISLCPKCHQLTRYKKLYWKERLQLITMEQ